MHYSRAFPLMAVLGFALVGCNSSQTTAPGSGGNSNQVQKSPDEQFADLRQQYDALTDADKRGEKGKQLMAELAKLGPMLSEQAREAAGRLQASHNLAQIGDAIHKNVDGPKFPDPNALKFPDRGTPKINFPTDPTKVIPVDPGKLLPFDPTKIDPTKLIPIDPGKLLPELKLPIDPTKLLPIDPGSLPKGPDGKPQLPSIPEFPKFPDSTLPMPREVPGR